VSAAPLLYETPKEFSSGQCIQFNRDECQKIKKIGQHHISEGRMAQNSETQKIEELMHI
jgi:hypothetical protein